MQPKTLLLAVIAVLLFDTLASLASRSMGFAYAWASIGSYAIYFSIGAFAARTSNGSPVQTAAIAAAVAGLADASIGWWISWQIGPGKPAPNIAMTPGRWISTAIMVVGLAAAVGAVGGLVGRPSSSTSAT